MVNSDRYCAMLQNFFQPQLGEIINDQHGADNVWFQQDGATDPFISSFPFTSQRNVSWTCYLLAWCYWVAAAFERFQPLRFLLWGNLKAKVYEQRPVTLEPLKEAIQQEVAAITPEMTLKLMDNYQQRLYQCINIQGTHLSDVLFKTR